VGVAGGRGGQAPGEDAADVHRFLGLPDREMVVGA
jgi:hypothetical protein